MSTKKPLLVVLGATGTQGGSVLSHFLSQSPCPYTLRGMTRDPTSVKAVSLALQGVEMVAGSYDDLSSLDAAFADAAIIYSVTDFWQGFFSPSQREQAAAAGKSIGVFSREVEGQQSRNIIDAAAKIVGSSLERFIFSGLPNLSVLSGGKYAHVFTLIARRLERNMASLLIRNSGRRRACYMLASIWKITLRPRVVYFGPN